MGSVYEAFHLRVPRRFAVKLLNPEIATTQEILDRFQREAEIAGTLGDEHIIQVFDFNRATDGTPYMVLELLDGEDLARRLSRGPLSVPETVELITQVTGALHKAHQAGIVHRDLKPSNLFLCRSERGLHVKVMDFGISKVLHQGGSGTRTGVVLGTPNYMSPEQAQGLLHEVDLRSDIFSLGAILYECLTGRMAFTGVTPIAAIMSVCQSEPVPLTTIAPGVPAAIEHVVRRALAKRRQDRHSSVGELRDDLMRAAQIARVPPRGDVLRAGISSAELPVAPRAVPPTTLGSAPGQVLRVVPDAPRRGRRAAAVVGALGVVGVTVAVLASIRSGSSETTGTAPASPLPPVAAAPPTLAVASPQVALSPPPTSPPTAPAAPAATAAEPGANPAPVTAEPAIKPATPVVHIRLDVFPPEAAVEIDGRPVSERELDVDPGRELHITARAPGYQALRVSHRAAADGAVSLRLIRPKPIATPHKKPDQLVEDKW
jgi:serine/threonine-protein kinase